MLLLDRYLIREILRTTFAVTVVLLLLIASKLLMQQLGYVMEGKFSGGLVSSLLLNKLFAYFVHLMPFLVLLSAVLALGQLYRGNEITSLHFCGYSERRLLQVLFVLGIPLSALLAVMVLFVTPQLSQQAEISHHQARLESGIGLAVGGRFVQTQDGKWAMYAGRAAEDVAEDVFFAIYDPQTQQVHIETAERVRRHLNETQQQYLLDFEHGHRYSGWPGDADLSSMSYERHRLRIDVAVPEHAWSSPKYMTLGQLLDADSSAAAGELQWRLSLPISLLLVLVLALLLARQSVRQGKYAGVVYAVLIYLGYAQLQLMATSQVRSGNWAVWAGVWWVHVLMAGAVAALFYWHRRHQLRWHRFGDA